MGKKLTEEEAVVTLRQRLLTHIKIELENDCWHYTGTKYPAGYGKVFKKNKTLLAHRASYEIFVGPIPSGLTIDHLCRNRSCINPKHLEPVTMRENTLRGNTLPGINARKTQCKNGHSFDGVDKKTGARKCSICIHQKYLNKKRGVGLVGI